MKSLQMKYNILHILFFITYVSVYGYIAIFLQYRGLSNTQIGIVTGGGAILSIFLQPFISSLIYKIKGLTIKKLIVVLYIFMFFMFISLNFITHPILLIMLFYILLTTFVTSIIPFLSVICMNYLKKGHYINFGLSRGFGSISYAIGAVIIGQLIDFFNPTVISYIHLIFGILFLVLLYTLPDFEIETLNQKKQTSTVASVIMNYRTFYMILIGFGFMYAASTSLSTYLVNIVSKLGGNTFLYGIAVFCMAASEMPVMSITHRLLKKYNAETLILVAAGCYILRNFTISLAPNLIILMIGMMFQGFSYGLLTATITYYVSDHLKENDQMIGQTLIGIMSTGVGSSIGNICGGILQDSMGLNSMLIFVCFITIAGFIITFLSLKKYIKIKE